VLLCLVTTCKRTESCFSVSLTHSHLWSGVLGRPPVPSRLLLRLQFCNGHKWGHRGPCSSFGPFIAVHSVLLAHGPLVASGGTLDGQWAGRGGLAVRSNLTLT
jgi:hypothetical protein